MWWMVCSNFYKKESYILYDLIDQPEEIQDITYPTDTQAFSSPSVDSLTVCGWTAFVQSQCTHWQCLSWCIHDAPECRFIMVSASCVILSFYVNQVQIKFSQPISWAVILLKHKWSHTIMAFIQLNGTGSKPAAVSRRCVSGFVLVFHFD